MRSGSTEDDFGINQLMGQVSRMRPEAVENFADRFLAGANALYQKIQGHSNPTRSQEFGSMADSNSLPPDSGTDLLPIPFWSEQDAFAVPLDGVWPNGLSIPIATELPPPINVRIAQFQNPGQDVLQDNWAGYFIIPQAFDLVPDSPFTLDGALPMPAEIDTLGPDALWSPIPT